MSDCVCHAIRAVDTASFSNPFSNFDSSKTFAPSTSTSTALPSFPKASNLNNNQINNGGDEYTTKMAKLNSSFLRWMDVQIVDKPLAVWKGAVQVI
jgi:hypothetical protein